MKPRLAKLKPKDLAIVHGWLCSEIPYVTIQRRLRKHYGIELSISRLCRYYAEQLAVAEPPAPAALVPLVDIYVIAGGVPLRIRVDAPAGVTISAKEGAK